MVDEPPNCETIAQYSRTLDQHRNRLAPLPFPSAFEFMAGADIPPDARNGPERAVWQRIATNNIPPSDMERARHIVVKYPFDSPRDLLDRHATQQQLAALFDCDVRFDAYDSRFATDLITRVDDGYLLSETQEQYLRHFVYRYRDQLEDQIIYERNGSDRLYEMLGDDPRQAFSDIIAACESAHDDIQTRYDSR